MNIDRKKKKQTADSRQQTNRIDTETISATWEEERSGEIVEIGIR